MNFLAIRLGLAKYFLVVEAQFGATPLGSSITRANGSLLELRTTKTQKSTRRLPNHTIRIQTLIEIFLSEEQATEMGGMGFDDFCKLFNAKILQRETKHCEDGGYQ